MAPSKKIKMLVKTNILKDNKEYKPGDKIELTEEEVKSMPWAVEFDTPFKLTEKKLITNSVPVPDPEEDAGKGSEDEEEAGS